MKKTTSIATTASSRSTARRSPRSTAAKLTTKVPGSPAAEKAVALIREWLSDESGYDEATWPVAKRAIEESRLSERKKFAD